MGESAGREDDRLARPNRQALSASAAGLDTNDFIALVAYDTLNPIPDADVDVVVTGCGGHRPDCDFAAVRHRIASTFGQKNPPLRRLVLGKFRPVVRHIGAMPVFKRAFFGKQLGRPRGVVVNRLVYRVFPFAHSEFSVRGIIDFGPRQARHVSDAVALWVLNAQCSHRSVVWHPVPKAALRVVPPSSDAFSRRRTSFPNHRENKAAESPPAPEPTTTISTSASKLFGRTGAAEARSAVWREVDTEYPP